MRYMRQERGSLRPFCKSRLLGERLSVQRFVLRTGTVCNTDLERLDFDNNPATTIKAYRHQLVRRLPRVTELDGEEVTPLDRELAQQYAASEGVCTLHITPCHGPFPPLSAGGGSKSACELPAASFDSCRHTQIHSDASVPALTTARVFCVRAAPAAV